jgi:methylamine dehydrogenase accessory protein MauD
VVYEVGNNNVEGAETVSLSPAVSAPAWVGHLRRSSRGTKFWRKIAVSIFYLISIIALWVSVLVLAFLFIGTARLLGLLRWRLEQLEATTPNRLGRNGLRVGKKAPSFVLRSTSGQEVSLNDFSGRRVLLVFTKDGCGPCQAIMPELNKVEGESVQVIVVNRGTREATREWAEKFNPRFPVLNQEALDLPRRYETFVTPFAFLIDEQGVIRSKGIVNSKQHIGFVLSQKGGDIHPEDKTPETWQGGTVRV